MRSNNPLLDAAQNENITTPPRLDVEAAPASAIAQTLAATVKPGQKPPKYSEIFKNVGGKSGSSGSVSSTNTSNLGTPPNYSSKVIIDQIFCAHLISLIMHLLLNIPHNMSQFCRHQALKRI